MIGWWLLGATYFTRPAKQLNTDTHRDTQILIINNKKNSCKKSIFKQWHLFSMLTSVCAPDTRSHFIYCVGLSFLVESVILNVEWVFIFFTQAILPVALSLSFSRFKCLLNNDNNDIWRTIEGQKMQIVSVFSVYIYAVFEVFYIVFVDIRDWTFKNKYA